MQDIFQAAVGRNSEIIRIERENDGPGWLVLRHRHGWLHGTLAAALADARSMGIAVLAGGRA
jgi:hypothetical protein